MNKTKNAFAFEQKKIYILNYMEEEEEDLYLLRSGEM